jgi:hypothetical protein
MEISISGEGQPGIALVSDELQTALRGLFLLYERHQVPLKSATYTYDQRPDGRWSFQGAYEYL